MIQNGFEYMSLKRFNNIKKRLQLQIDEEVLEERYEEAAVSLEILNNLDIRRLNKQLIITDELFNNKIQINKNK